MGFNYHGQIKSNSKDEYILELEKRITELEKGKRRKLKKFNFSNILPKVSEKNLPWI